MEKNGSERIMIKKKKNCKIISYICVFIIVAIISGCICSKIVVEKMIQKDRLNDSGELEAYFEQMLSKGITSVSHSIVTIGDSIDKLNVNTRGEGNVTGIVIDEQGYIATSLSKIKNMNDIFVKLPSLAKEPIEADLIGADEKTDVALIKIVSDEIVPIIMNEGEIKDGNFVFAAGNSISNDFIGMVTVGVVTSTENRIHDDVKGDLYTIIQTNAIINDENIGGALCNIQGELVGFNGIFLNNNGESNQLYYSLNSTDLKKIVDYIIKFTDKLGISGEVIDDKDSGVKGLYVKNVIPGGRAARWGILPTDIILSLDNNEITSLEDINDVIRNKNNGENIDCKILRYGTNTTIQVLID